jgi:murein DD-endopeptidase MepM/ murein hydrolase activator NlpD
MRQALLEEEPAGEGLGSDTMTDTFDVEFARYLSMQGGIGLARNLQRYLPGQDAGPVAETESPVAAATAAGGGPAIPAAAVPTAHAAHGSSASKITGPGLALPLDAPVTSAFGWRQDPLVGTPRFHGGIDLKAAYGREVPTVAAGRVIFAGEQGGYGQTVVIEHAGGLQTRYAHLSAIGVEAGQDLARGQIVGRVGRSGRATGPHLHFEVSRDGKKLDPAELARMFPGEFKSSAGGVDFPFDGASTRASSIGADHEG